MRRTNTLWRKGQFCRAMAGLKVLLLTLSWAGSATAQQSVEAQRQAVIQGILDDNAGDPAGLVDAIKNIFGNLQGAEAVARAQQLLAALPSELSDSQWASIKTAIGDKAGDLVSSSASQAIMSQLAAKESALGKTQLQASVVTDADDSADSGDAGESSRASSAPMAPPQDQVDCASASCQ
jgi:hypothetical protein